MRRCHYQSKLVVKFFVLGGKFGYAPVAVQGKFAMKK